MDFKGNLMPKLEKKIGVGVPSLNPCQALNPRVPRGKGEGYERAAPLPEPYWVTCPQYGGPESSSPLPRRFSRHPSDSARVLSIEGFQES